MMQDRAVLAVATNNKSYMVYRTAPFLLTMNNP